MPRQRDPDEDDARADDFRCHGCEAPLPSGWRGRVCVDCQKGGLGGEH